MNKSTVVMSKKQGGNSSMIGIIGSECDDTRKRDNLQGSYLKKGSRGTKSYCRSRATGSRKNEKSSLGPTKLGKKSSHLIANPKSSRSSVARISCIPENVAVHFGKFYNLDESSSNDDDCCRKIGMTKTEFPDCVPPRSQFTRQMVNKLERLAGTKYYAQQVSALLKETLEPPDFMVKSLPFDNFIPNEIFDTPDYPLWYKEPDKMPYKSATNNYLTTEVGTRKNEPMKDQRSVESAKSNCTVTTTNSAHPTSGSRRTVDSTDYDESFSSSPESTSDSDSNTEAESDYDEIEATFVK